MNSTTRQPMLTRAVSGIGTATAAAATCALWFAALGFYAFHVVPARPNTSLPVFDFTETLLLALACLAFQLAALRVGLDDFARIWRTAVDPDYAAADPARWRVFGWIGSASWIAAVGIGVPIIASLWRPDSTDLIFALVIVLIPAVQCTGAAVVGPILTHAFQERETAAEARASIRAAAQIDRDAHIPGA